MAPLEAGLQRLWYGRSWRAALLLPLSLLFRALVGLRRASYRAGVLRTHAAPVPVIVVGNLTVGGTGKTPVTAWLARLLTARGLRVAIVLRGYGGTHRGSPRIVRLSDNPAEVGDEAVLHARRGVHVVVVGADRVAAARQAAARGAEVVLCDDGLQHYRLARDYEIAVVDATRALGNGWLLPAGPLREPAARLETVDAIVATSRRADASASNEPLCSRRPPRLAAQLRLGTAVNLVDGERRALASFTTATDLHAVAAVGHPQAFFAALRAAGLQVLTHALPDHAALDPAALPFPPQATVLMTEKDAVKCRGFAQPGWWWVELEVEVDAAATDELLESLFERIRRARPGVSLG